MMYNCIQTVTDVLGIVMNWMFLSPQTSYVEIPPK